MVGLLIDVGTVSNLSWGYWFLLSSVACVVTGAIVVVVSEMRETGAADASDAQGAEGDP
ncbi:MAG: hypothetical protein ACRDMH_17175 [Solirubrobacterales bacterium]